MKKIEVYKCIFCSEIFDDRDECTIHEQVCPERMDTMTCLNCKFYRDSTLLFQPGGLASIPICLRNIDISEGFKQQCDNYIDDAASIGKSILKQAERNFDPTSLFKMLMRDLFPNNENGNDFELPF
ncbi:hypothetical protein [Maribellus mangrovi]|uniref:hypothetical protein n=1 Tax=Maribellus mangrovi TaxID=3133146 RepID=UPI0030EDC641